MSTTTTSALIQQLESRTMLTAVVIAGSDGDDVIHARQITDDLAGPRLDVWLNADPQQAPPTHQFPLEAPNSLHIDAGLGNDVIRIDMPPAVRRVTLLGGQGDDALDVSAGAWPGDLTYDAGDGDDSMILREPLGRAYLRFDGGAGTDSFRLVAARDGYWLMLGTSENVRRGLIHESSYTHLNVENEIYELTGGLDHLKLHGDFGRRRIEPGDAPNEIRIHPDHTQRSITLKLDPGADDHQFLTFFDGEFVISADLALLSPRLRVNVSGHSTSLQVQTSQSFRDLRVTDAASIALAPGGGKVLSLVGLKVDEQSRLDLADNELRSRSPSVADLETAVARARNTGPTPWTGPGITSSTAPQDPLTGLAVVVRGNTSIARLAPNGDTNLDGKINIDDYAAIDTAFLAQPLSPLYTQGDFNYDGKVNADDYFLIDSAFLGQGPGSANQPPQLPSPAVPPTPQPPRRPRQGRPSIPPQTRPSAPTRSPSPHARSFTPTRAPSLP